METIDCLNCVLDCHAACHANQGGTCACAARGHKMIKKACSQGIVTLTCAGHPGRAYRPYVTGLVGLRLTQKPRFLLRRDEK